MPNLTQGLPAITPAFGTAIAQALERHRKLGESIAVWRDGKVVILTADQIPPTPSTATRDN